jgi:hypothetical protein
MRLTDAAIGKEAWTQRASCASDKAGVPLDAFFWVLDKNRISIHDDLYASVELASR